MFNQWTMFPPGTSSTGNAAVSYYDPTNYIAGQASNYTIGNTAIGVLKCPDDVTAQPNQGNLSYAVNGGFALWHAIPYSLIGSQLDGGETSQILTWAPGTTYLSTMGVCQKLGVMFLQSTFPQGTQITVPWNVTSTLTSISDGSSSTLLMSENTLTGVATPSAFTGGLEGNWAAPQPTLSMFIGSSAVCASAGYVCTTGTLAPASVLTGAGTVSGDLDGPGWSYANKVGTFENINFAQSTA